MKKGGSCRVLLNNHHVDILRFLMDNKDKQKRFNINTIAGNINNQPTKTRAWISDLAKYELFILNETKKKPKRYDK